MSIFTRLLGRLGNLFGATTADIGREFNVKLISSAQMQNALNTWDNIAKGKAPWVSAEDNIKTVNMAKFIADTRAKLTTLDIGVNVSGSSARAQFLQNIVDDLIKRLPEKMCEADRLGGMMIRWNGESWDFVLPGSFGVTEVNGNKEIIGAIFAVQAVEGKNTYTRLEYHRFIDVDGESLYQVTNKAFRNSTDISGNTTLGTPVPLTEVRAWAHLQPDTYIRGLTKPLFAYYRVPGSNTIDDSSPLGMSIFANAITELKAIDVSISRKDTEIEDSKHMTFIGQTIKRSADNRNFKLPRFVQQLGIGLEDSGNSSIKEHVATLLTDERLRDINFDLSMAGVKCGFSEGVFVLDGQRGMVTATQIESDDRDTIQTIKDDRDALQTALEQAIEGADKITTLMNLCPLGEYELTFAFGDITYSYEEDKANWRLYAMQGWVPKWLYFVKFEKMSEEEAKAMIAEAQIADAEVQLFQQSLSAGGED
jgi:A118 family predicted phage portal protein